MIYEKKRRGYQFILQNLLKITMRQVRVLDTIPAIENDETIIGQYGKSEDDSKPAFTDEEDVPDDSQCATFCAAVARIENERWTGVPFLLKAGKGKPCLRTVSTSKSPVPLPLLTMVSN